MTILGSPEYTAVVNMIIKLQLMSHVSSSSIESNTSRCSDDSSGRPSGGLPSFDDFQQHYGQKSSVYFEKKLARCNSTFQLSQLLIELTQTLEAWRKTPLTKMEPSHGDPLFPRWVVNHHASDRELARLTGLSRQAINGIRRRYVL